MGAAGVSVVLMNRREFGRRVIVPGVVMARMVVRRMIVTAVVMFSVIVIGVIVKRGFVCRVTHRGVPKVLVAK
jgi:hypothetical protein